MTSTIEETGVLEDLDFEFSPPCHPDPEDCPNTAEWLMILTTPCCTYETYVCSSHREQFLDFMNGLLGSEVNLFCSVHDLLHVNAFPKKDVYYRFEPL